MIIHSVMTDLVLTLVHAVNKDLIRREHDEPWGNCVLIKHTLNWRHGHDGRTRGALMGSSEY